jgi:SAM-dependent methyltransferase
MAALLAKKFARIEGMDDQPISAPVACKICGCGRLRKLGMIRAYAIWKCPKCGFGQTDVAASDLLALYDHDYFSGKKVGFAQNENDPVYPYMKEWLDRYVSRAHRNVLEVGPGPGAMVGSYLTETRPNVCYESVEVSEYAVDVIRRKGFQAHLGGIEDPAVMVACTGQFDAVVATEVIEHVIDPGPFARCLFDVLKEHGTVYLTTGNFDGIQAWVKGLKWYYLDPPAHVVYYTSRSIRKLLTDAGFRSIRIEFIGAKHLALYRRWRLPGLLPLVHAARVSTGMTIVAKK